MKVKGGAEGLVRRLEKDEAKIAKLEHRVAHEPKAEAKHQEARLHPKERATKNRSAFADSRPPPSAAKPHSPVRERATKNRSAFANEPNVKKAFADVASATKDFATAGKDLAAGNTDAAAKEFKAGIGELENAGKDFSKGVGEFMKKLQAQKQAGAQKNKVL